MIKNDHLTRRSQVAGTTPLVVVTLLLGCRPQGDPMGAAFQGVVEFEERTLAFELPGRLLGVRVDEGQRVRAGQELARLDDTLERVNHEVAKAQATVTKARMTLAEAGTRPEDVRALRAALRAARSNEALAQQTLSREQVLTRTPASRPADLDAAASAHATAVARREELEQQVARARHGARPEELEISRAESRAAEASVHASEERLRRYTLQTAHEGLVLQVHREPEEFVGTGAPIVTLGDVGHPYVDFFVPQDRIDEVSLGAPASVRVDARAHAFAGEIEVIHRAAEFAPKFLFSPRERVNIVIRVRVRLDDPEHELWAGTPAFVVLGAES